MPFLDKPDGPGEEDGIYMSQGCTLGESHSPDGLMSC